MRFTIHIWLSLTHVDFAFCLVDVLASRPRRSCEFHLDKLLVYKLQSKTSRKSVASAQEMVSQRHVQFTGISVLDMLRLLAANAPNNIVAEEQNGHDLIKVSLMPLPTRPTSLCIDPCAPEFVKKDLHGSCCGRDLLFLSSGADHIMEFRICCLAFRDIRKEDDPSCRTCISYCECRVSCCEARLNSEQQSSSPTM
jgi:hypothetical protein